MRRNKDKVRRGPPEEGTRWYVTKSSALWPQAQGKPSGLFHVELLSKLHKVKGGAHCPEWELPSKPFRSGGCQASRGWCIKVNYSCTERTGESAERSGSWWVQEDTASSPAWGCGGAERSRLWTLAGMGALPKQLLAPQQLRAQLPPSPSGRLRKKIQMQTPTYEALSEQKSLYSWHHLLGLNIYFTYH